MGLDFAIDELYATGWTALDSTDCDYLADGRCFPRVSRVMREFHELGCELAIRYVQLFDCHRAEWKPLNGNTEAQGAVVGKAEAEAAVYALAQLRRQVLSSVATA
ncbi:MAG TPA: hypothetical protein VK176_02550 [Phycisphaerales bacterium]|nr:hypothetical protein [Phycisphaerales bacterium]